MRGLLLELYRRDTLPLFNLYELVCLEVFKGLHQATRPANFKALDSGCFTQSKVNARVVVRQVAPPAPDLGYLHQASRFSGDPRTNCVPVAFRSHQTEGDPMISIDDLIAQERRSIIVIYHKYIQIAIVINIAESGPSARFFN